MKPIGADLLVPDCPTKSPRARQPCLSLTGPSLAWGLLLGLLLAGTTRSRGAAGAGHCQCQWDRSLESRGVVAIEALR